jgi:Arc/MetJ-type ribon-helix-helix transcriptional regulator
MVCMNDGRPPDRPRGRSAPNVPPQLSALERALRQALDSVPREQVVKCVASVLPTSVLVEESGRLHGGKVRKVSVSMPEELAEAVRARTGAGGFSRYVTDAVQEQVRLDLLDELSAELRTEFGPFDEAQVHEAMKLWSDQEEET